jgi:outer membrane biosynthesis protein TonB
MAQEPGAVEQAVSRALRDNLAALQRNAEELRAAVDDVVAACSSAKPTNALPPMLRAQAAAASTAAILEVLSRFITGSLMPPQRTALEDAVMRAVSVPAAAPIPPPPAPVAEVPAPRPVEVAPLPPSVVEEIPPPPPPEPEPAPVVAEAVETHVEAPPPPPVEAPAPAPGAAFEVKSLPFEEQELHRKANRHAKVSMQDIKMYRKEEIKLGQQNYDLCSRLKEDIDKARKEYDRRFRGILNHPVDYFYDWMVQILAEGDPKKLGEYPYPSPVLRR